MGFTFPSDIDRFLLWLHEQTHGIGTGCAPRDRGVARPGSRAAHFTAAGTRLDVIEVSWSGVRGGDTFYVYLRLSDGVMGAQKYGFSVLNVQEQGLLQLAPALAVQKKNYSTR